MNCEWLRAATNFDCVPITGLRHEPGIEIGTPFSYADGTAIVLYALETGAHVLLSDNGDMLAHLSSVGLNPERRIAVLRERVERHGLTLSSDGDVRALVPREQAPHTLLATITALLAVAEWEREQMEVSEQTRNLADDAEILLRAWRPLDRLERRPSIRGQSKQTHRFDFLLGNEYVDIISPNHTATGGTMRKVGDVKNSPFLMGRDIRVVIDDRDDPERAEIERQILGSLARSMLFSQLERLAAHKTAH